MKACAAFLRYFALLISICTVFGQQRLSDDVAINTSITGTIVNAGTNSESLFGYSLSVNRFTGIVSAPGKENGDGFIYTLTKQDSFEVQQELSAPPNLNALFFGYNVEVSKVGDFAFASYVLDLDDEPDLGTEFNDDNYILNAKTGGVVVLRHNGENFIIDSNDIPFADGVNFNCQVGQNPGRKPCLTKGFATSFDQAGLERGIALIGAPLAQSDDFGGFVFFAETNRENKFEIEGNIPIPVEYDESECGFSVSYLSFADRGFRTAAVGCPNYNEGAGIVLIFSFNIIDRSWKIEQELTSFDDGQDREISPACLRFGSNVELTSGGLVIGCPKKGINAGDNGNGRILDNSIIAPKVFVYDADLGGSYFFLQTLENEDESVENFSHSVSVDGDFIIVGAPGSFRGGGVTPGKIFIYSRSAEQNRFTLLNQFEQQAAGFGFSVSIDQTGEEVYDMLASSVSGDPNADAVLNELISVETIIDFDPPTASPTPAPIELADQFEEELRTFKESVPKDSIRDKNSIFAILLALFMFTFTVGTI